MARQAGYAYLFLLFLVALLSISALAVGQLEYYAGVRSDEAELLRIGGEFRHALTSYRDAAMPKVYPTRLEDLLSDRRSGVEKRHLRKIYFDPFTRTREWGLVREEGRIVGVHSLADGKPFKVAGFEPDDSGFAGAEHYSDWVFQPGSTAQAVPDPSAD